MNGMIRVITYDEPAFNQKEILRYAGGGGENAEVLELMEKCISELKGRLSYKVCARAFRVDVSGENVDLEFAKVNSKALERNLSGCEEAVVFAATIGLEIDRLIARYGRTSPSKALMFQAIGAERIESLCDAFNEDVRKYAECKGLGVKPRFSPGYGDLPIELQRDVFSVLDCPRKIGLTLNDSFLMSPSKSVTAIIGIGGDMQETTGKCSKCENINCLFRSE